MRNPSKNVPRAELEAMKELYLRAQIALDAVLNHESEFPIRVKKSDSGVTDSMNYTFRFITRRFSTLVIVTFGTVTQRASSSVYDLEKETDSCQRNTGSDWSRIWMAAIHARQMKKQAQKEVA